VRRSRAGFSTASVCADDGGSSPTMQGEIVSVEMGGERLMNGLGIAGCVPVIA